MPREVIEDTPKDKLDEWLASLYSINPPDTIEGAEALKEHAIDDLAEDGVTEAMIDEVTGGKFALYVLRAIGHSKWSEPKSKPKSKKGK